MIDYEAEYNNCTRVPEAAAIVDRWDREAMAYRGEARRAGRAELGLSYGTTERQIVDLFRPASGDGAALAVLVPGEDWRTGAPSTFSHMARGLNAHGVAVAVIGYDLCPRVRLGDIVRQVRQACLFLWWRYGQRMLTIGHSAGGHLAACLVASEWGAVESGAPDDLVGSGLAVSGIFDLAPLLNTSLNADLRLAPQEAERLSPVRWPIAAGRSFDVVVGAGESSEFRRQSRALAETWAARGVDVRHAEVPGADHFTVLHPLSDPASEMVARLVARAEAL
ncbi:MAG TPA: alpha/beta hydrolase [Xanthobacteraceae bacterium]|nr:alpha/beta hydrolase [Xanthobacteraceae bacterium]